ncbi:spore germination lipoprotein GerD [Bacillus sp. Marseille-P3661]|uniref:spore germination lipoprotein GerD n=1 Tax=Bacillus sp. Marseille-P3661 TaxID=1936234 RepID=UPI000C85A9E7|nr:spore germination lipoprotein GerD [Bacillus sp. Marseille-P3661]
MKNILMLLLLLLFLISACAPAEIQGNNQPDYDTTKKMVVDILKTDEGKKAIEEIVTNEDTKAQLVMDQPFVQQSIKTALTSEEALNFWKKQFEDPKFTEAFAKSMQAEHEKLIKGLMKDPDYQAMMIDILKDPEMEKQLLDAMKSQQYRDQLKTLISETIESPLFKAKMQDMLIKGAEELQKEEAAKQEEKQKEE